MAVVEQVGLDVLASLIRQALPDMAADSVKALNPGASGAAVLAVESKAGKQGDDLSTVLKLSKLSGAIEDELRRQPAPGTVASGRSVPQATDRVHYAGAWSAAAFGKAEDSMPLSDYLRITRLTAASRHALKALVTESLSRPIRQSHKWDGANPPANDFHLRFTYASTIYDSLSGLLAMSSVLREEWRDPIHRVQDYVEATMKEPILFLHGRHRLCKLHGDFHCGNVMMARDGTHVLIDWARRNTYPRLFDVASLEADVILRVMDSSEGKSHRFDRVNRWTDDSRTMFPFANAVPAQPPRSAIEFLRRSLHEAVSQLLDLNHAEYGEALAFQLLRYIRFDIPAPKKILAALLVANLIDVYHLRPSNPS